MERGFYEEKDAVDFSGSFDYSCRISYIFIFAKLEPRAFCEAVFKSVKTQDKESMRHVYTADILSIAQNRLEEAVASGIDAAIEHWKKQK